MGRWLRAALVCLGLTLSALTVNAGNTVLVPGTGIYNVVEDTTPTLGGDLDANGNDITSVGDLTASGTITGETLAATGAVDEDFSLDLDMVTGTPSVAAMNHRKVVNDDGILAFVDDTGVYGNAIYSDGTAATDNAVCRMDGTTGEKVQGSTGASIDDSGNLTAASFTTTTAYAHILPAATLAAGVYLPEPTNNGSNGILIRAGSNVNLTGDFTIRPETISRAPASQLRGPAILVQSDAAPGAAAQDTGTKACNQSFNDSQNVLSTCVSGSVISFGNSGAPALTFAANCDTSITQNDWFLVTCNVPNTVHP